MSLTVTTLTNSIKNRAKKLFKAAFNLTKLVITVKDIKRQFSLFDGRKAVHWFNLIDKLELQCQANDKAEQAKKIDTMTISEFNQYCHEQVLEACKKYGCVVHSSEWLGYSSKLSTKDYNGVMRVIGSIHINRQNVVSISWTRTAFKVCSNVNQGFQILLSMFRKPAIAA